MCYAKENTSRSKVCGLYYFTMPSALPLYLSARILHLPFHPKHNGICKVTPFILSRSWCAGLSDMSCEYQTS